MISTKLWHHFCIAHAVYASGLLARKIAAEIVTRLQQPESCDVIKNAGWL